MNRQELLQDWYVRYRLIFNKRYTIKQKDRFLKSLSADILPFRKDIKLVTFKLNEKDKNEYRNLYVGNVKKRIPFSVLIMIRQQFGSVHIIFSM